MRAHAQILIALIFFCVEASTARAGSVEATLEEINRLPSAARQQRLEEGARREGAFVQYSVSNGELIGAFVKAFGAKYPFIKTDYWRGSGNQLVFRTFMEHRAGKLAADVISVGTENVIAMKEAGLYARYRSPESRFYPPEQTDRDGYFHSDSLGLSTIAYNNRLVKHEDAPTGYDDLLDPKWKGSLTIDLEPERALMGWLVAWGEARTRAYVEKLRTNGVSVRRGHTLQAQLLCAGEFKIAVEIYPDAILRMKKSGCPATLVFGNPTSGVVGGNYAIYALAAHPHAAALFVDFALSAEGAKILAATGRVQRRKGMKALYEELSDLEEKGVPLLVVTPQQTTELIKPMEKIMKELVK